MFYYLRKHPFAGFPIVNREESEGFTVPYNSYMSNELPTYQQNVHLHIGDTDQASTGITEIYAENINDGTKMYYVYNNSSTHKLIIQGFNNLIVSKTYQSLYGYEEQGYLLMGGKYKIPDKFFKTNNILADCIIPFNGKIVKSNGTEITFKYIAFEKSSWHQENIVSLSAPTDCGNRIAFYSELPEEGDIPSDYTYLTLPDFETISEYQNGYIDFGDIPSEMYGQAVEFFQQLEPYEPVTKYTITVKSFNNSSVYINQVEMPATVNGFDLNNSGTSRTLKVQRNGLTVQTLAWTGADKPNSTFLGLSTLPNSDTSSIAFSPIRYNIDKNLVFYEAFINNPVPITSTKIDFFNNSAEPNRVNKTQFLANLTELEGSFRESVNIENPVFIVKYDGIFKFNYCRISAFGRYYFITSVTNNAKNVWTINCKSDVLMSFNREIRNLQCIIERQENSYNKYLQDNNIPSEVDKTVSYRQIGVSPFDVNVSTTSNFVLIYNE